MREEEGGGDERDPDVLERVVVEDAFEAKDFGSLGGPNLWAVVPGYDHEETSNNQPLYQSPL